MICYGYVDVRSGVDLPRSEEERLDQLSEMERDIENRRNGEGLEEGRGLGSVRKGDSKGRMSEVGGNDCSGMSASADGEGMEGTSAYKGKGKERMSDIGDAEQTQDGAEDAMDEG